MEPAPRRSCASSTPARTGSCTPPGNSASANWNSWPSNEQVGHLIDVLIRRTSLAFRGLVTGELLNEVADVLAGPLGWDAATRAAEIHHAQEVLERFHGVQVHSLVA